MGNITNRRCSTEPKFRKYFKGYSLLSFARKFGDKYGKKLKDTTTKTGIDAAKTASKRVVQKTAEATGWYGKTRVTSHEFRVASDELRVTNWKLKKHELKFKSTSWNSNPRVTSSNPRVKSSNQQVASSNSRVTSLNPRVQESLNH